jgi:predicted nucleic acid-binding protein
LGNFTAFLDACVLYSAPLRDLLLELAIADLYRAKWSDAVLDECINHILENRPDLTSAQLERTRSLMNRHARDAVVKDYEDLIGVIDLPDKDDRHVLAAAIKGRADLIVTFNLKDFPADKLARWGLAAQHPDDFLVHQFHLREPVFLQAVRTVRLRLKKPPKTVEEYRWQCWLGSPTGRGGFAAWGISTCYRRAVAGMASGSHVRTTSAARSATALPACCRCRCQQGPSSG